MKVNLVIINIPKKILPMNRCIHNQDMTLDEVNEKFKIIRFLGIMLFLFGGEKVLSLLM